MRIIEDTRIMTLILTAADVAELLALDDCIAAVEEAFRAHGEGRLHPPGILSEHAERGAFHIKTSTIGRHFVAKTNANFPGRQPTIQGVVLLFDTEEGTPLAVMDSIEITARRTAAASAVAAKYLAARGRVDVTVFGWGKQGRVHLDAIRRVLDVGDVQVIDPALGRAEARPTLESDVILTCTTSREPLLHAKDVKRGAFIAAVGADNPAKWEIDPQLLAASVVVTDVTDQAATLGDLHHAIDAGLVTRGHVRAELGAHVA